MTTKFKSVDDANSRYTWGGETFMFPNRAGWWERRDLEHDDATDRIIDLPEEYDRRPDLMAYDLYGNVRFSTLILQYNRILDINTEFVTGVPLRLPSRQRVTFDIVNQTPGGTSHLDDE